MENDEAKLSVILLLDFQKAFDRADNSTLLLKAKAMGMDILVSNCAFVFSDVFFAQACSTGFYYFF